MPARRVVWIISHFEYLGPPYRRDEVVTAVAATKARARRHLRTHFVDPGTWWGIQPFRMEDEDFFRPQVLYSRTGREMKRGYSLKRALQLSRRLRARNRALKRRRS